MSEALQHPEHRELTDREREILAFEASWRPGQAGREAEIRERFDISTPRYHQLLNALIDAPEALEYKPLLVKRLRRERSRRQQLRSARRLHA